MFKHKTLVMLALIMTSTNIPCAFAADTTSDEYLGFQIVGRILKDQQDAIDRETARKYGKTVASQNDVKSMADVKNAIARGIQGGCQKSGTCDAYKQIADAYKESLDQ